MRLSTTVMVLSLLTLGACATDEVATQTPPPVTPSERYAIEVRPAPEELKLAAHADGLSANQETVLAEFARQWMQADGGAITLKSPEHGADPAAAYRTVTAARDFLVSQGVIPEKVRIVGYDAAGDLKAPILVGYVRYQAKGPDCGTGWEDISKDDSNEPYDHFGCAVTANIAAEIAYPADLLNPHEMDSADAGRRATVIEKYRQAAPTSTPADTQADGSFSSVGK